MTTYTIAVPSTTHITVEADSREDGKILARYAVKKAVGAGGGFEARTRERHAERPFVTTIEEHDLEAMEVEEGEDF